MQKHHQRRIHLGALTMLFTAFTLSACGAGDEATDRASTDGAPAAAAEKTSDPALARTPAQQAVADVALASQLASLGVRTNSAHALTAAAEILIANPTRAFQGTSADAAAAAAPADRTGKTAAEPVELTATALLARAQQLAGGDAQLAAAIQGLQTRTAAGSKGAVGGPQEATDRVEANATDTWTVTFRAKEPGSIRVIGDGDTDLDCYVYDPSDRLMDLDDDLTDYCILDWFSAGGGTHRLEIRNLGNVWNQYDIITN